MERDATWTRAAVSRRTRRLVGALAALLAGCSSAALLYSSRRTPPEALPAAATAGSTAPEPRSAEAPGELELRPLLTEPRYRAVVDALESDDARGAARALADRLERDGEAGQTALFWLGRLWERAGESALAARACEKARGRPGPLGQYARLCLGRAQLALGQAAGALSELGSAVFDPPIENQRRLVVARAVRAKNQRDQAIQAYRLALEQGEAEPDAAWAATALELVDLLLEPESASAQSSLESLSLARRAELGAPSSSPLEKRARELEKRSLSALPQELQKEHQRTPPDLVLMRLSVLADARDHETLEREAHALIDSLSSSMRFETLGCEARILRAKGLTGLKRYGEAVDSLSEARRRCRDRDQGARIAYLSARYAAFDGRDTAAVRLYAELEERYPESSLADDARYQAALIYQELGAEARFTELLSSMPDAYPKGDMVADGLFRLALRRIERGLWGEASPLLERAVEHLGEADGARGQDTRGRERYFHARADLVQGQTASGLSELETVVSDFPLSYYMLQAFTRLHALSPERASRALRRSLDRDARGGVGLRASLGLEPPALSRLMELLRIGELLLAIAELDALNLGDEAFSKLSWSVAALLEQANLPKLSVELAKRRFGDVARRWPAGPWLRPWQTAFPRPYHAIVTREAKAAALDEALVYAVIREESAFDAEAVSPANAHGLMQLIVPTARHFGKKAGLPWGPGALKRPRVNVALGCRVLAKYSSQFEDNPLLGILAYNAGPGRPKRWLSDHPTADFDVWIELVPFQETRRYAKRVLSSRAAYAFLYDRDRAPSRLLLPESLVREGSP